MFNVAAPHCPKGSEPEYLLRRGLRECVNTPTDGRLSSSDYYLRLRGSDTLGNIRNKRAHIVADIFAHVFQYFEKKYFPKEENQLWSSHKYPCQAVIKIMIF